MPYAIELFLDDHADRLIRQIWTALDEHGLRSLGGSPDSRYHPHVSLSVYEHGDPVRVAAALRPVLAGCVGLPLTLAPLGFFLTDEAPVFLGVVPSSRLLALHHAVHRAIEPLVHGIWPHYRPDALVPHCTLAVGVADKARTVEIVQRFPVPIPASVSGAFLVETPGGLASTRLTPG